MTTEQKPVIHHAPFRGYYYVAANGTRVWIANGWYFYRRKVAPTTAPGQSQEERAE